MKSSISLAPRRPTAAALHPFTDGYGMRVWTFILSDPALQPGWRIVARHRCEHGEHIWTIETAAGERFRWLEDEGGPEWAYRTKAVPTLAA